MFIIAVLLIFLKSLQSLLKKKLKKCLAKFLNSKWSPLLGSCDSPQKQMVPKLAVFTFFFVKNKQTDKTDKPSMYVGSCPKKLGALATLN